MHITQANEDGMQHEGIEYKSVARTYDSLKP
jgi:hypothetical protein